MHHITTRSALLALASVALGQAALARVSAIGSGGVIPDLGTLTSDVTIGAGAGTVTNLTVELFSLRHTWSGDLVITLEHNGASASLLTRLGRTGGGGFGSASPFDGDYAFADGGADLWAVSAGLPFGTPLPAGAYRASGEDNANVSLMGFFGGMDASGLWRLTIVDAEEEDDGTLGRPFATGDGVFGMGWRLNVETVPAPGSAAALLAAIGAAGARRRR